MRNKPPFSTFSAYVLPRDEAYMRDKWWRPSQAANAWHCSRTTAYRLIEQYGEELGRCMIWVVKPNKTELLMVIKAGSKRPQTHRGNPQWRQSRYQSETARAREARKRNAHPPT